MLDILPLIRKKVAGRRILPKHIAITAEGSAKWMRDNNIHDKKEAFARKHRIVLELIVQQIRNSIPILSVLVLDNSEHSAEELESLHRMFSSLKSSRIVHDNQVKVSVLGKWYDIPGYIVEEIKKTIDETKDYDRYFLNLCVQYEGHEEIVDSCRLIARKIKAGKIDIDSINSEMLKENLYSSYFLPPDLVIKTGTKKTWSNLLLWDSSEAHYYFSGKLFNNFTAADFEKAIEDFNRFN